MDMDELKATARVPKDGSRCLSPTPAPSAPLTMHAGRAWPAGWRHLRHQESR